MKKLLAVFLLFLSVNNCLISQSKISNYEAFIGEYIDIDNLPKAEFYFVAESSNGDFFYGYINSRKDSEKIIINDNSYYALSDGIGYSNDGKTTCDVNSQLALVFNNVGGKVDVECTNRLKFNGIYIQQQDLGYGTGQTNKGDDINFKFYMKKETAVAVWKDTVIINDDDDDHTPIKPKGKPIF